MKTQCPCCKEIFVAIPYVDENNLSNPLNLSKIIIDIVCEILRVDKNDLANKKRTQDLASARQLICHLMYHSTKKNESFSQRISYEILPLLALKNHASIYTGSRKIEDFKQSYSDFNEVITEMEKIFSKIARGHELLKEAYNYAAEEKVILTIRKRLYR